MGSGSKLQESTELGLLPCREVGHLHGDRLTLDLCYIGMGERREVAAGPECPGKLWPEVLIPRPSTPTP